MKFAWADQSAVLRVSQGLIGVPTLFVDAQTDCEGAQLNTIGSQGSPVTPDVWDQREMRDALLPML